MIVNVGSFAFFIVKIPLKSFVLFMFLGHVEWKAMKRENIVKKAHVLMNHVEAPSKVTQFSSFSSKKFIRPRTASKTTSTTIHIKHCFYSFLRVISIKTWWAIKSLKAVSAPTIWLPETRRDRLFNHIFVSFVMLWRYFYALNIWKIHIDLNGQTLLLYFLSVCMRDSLECWSP